VGGWTSGAPLLGSAETVKALMSGVSFGLPISDVKLPLNSCSLPCIEMRALDPTKFSSQNVECSNDVFYITAFFRLYEPCKYVHQVKSGKFGGPSREQAAIMWNIHMYNVDMICSSECRGFDH
jgi:hypothetical protein